MSKIGLNLLNFAFQWAHHHKSLALLAQADMCHCRSGQPPPKPAIVHSEEAENSHALAVGSFLLLDPFRYREEKKRVLLFISTQQQNHLDI